MSATLLKEHGVNDSVKSEARQRINDARLSELKFHIGRIVTGAVSRDDLAALAAAILEGLDAREHVDRSTVIERLVDMGRTRHKAEQLASSLFK